MMWQKTSWSVFASLLLVLSACAETELAVHTVKEISVEQPTSQGAYKVGKPYQVAGTWYYPKVDYNYSETGIASWYGTGFHGKPTANGEIFDQFQLTAAHRTLPLPSVVQVTNLENGRSIKLRVNDRGPFTRNRIIDVSAKAAELLGFKSKGTAKVRVEILAAESRRAASLIKGGSVAVASSAPAVPLEPVATQNLDGNSTTNLPTTPKEIEALSRPATPKPFTDGVVTQYPVRPSDLFVQVGAFARVHNAVRLKARLASLGPSIIEEVTLGSARLYRVRMGPLRDVAEADRMLALLDRNGFPEARIVVQ